MEPPTQIPYYLLIRFLLDYQKNCIGASNLEEEDLSDEGGDEGEVSDLDEAGGNFSDNEVFELY